MISYVRMTQGKIFKVRDVASVVGQVISLTLCVARIMTRALYTVVNKKQSWNSKVEFTKGACDELTFWIGNVDSLNFRCPWLPFQSPARFVYSDASDYACSSFIENELKIFHQNWSATEGSQSSTWRELRTVDLALSAFAPDLQGKKVAWFNGNSSVVSIVHNRSRVEELQSLALSIFHVCASSGISLEMKWVPRDSNHQADSLSRIIDFDDYSINYDVFHMLDCKRGPHTVDRFACSSQFTDIFKEGIWKETETFQDPYLQSLTSRLQTSVLSARAPATTKMYHRAFRKWMDFALSKLNISFLPAKPVHVAI